jgi:hypothetical protein
MNAFGAEFLESTEAAFHGGLKYMDPITGRIYIDGTFYYEP